jgi:hypothetical protein
MEQQRIIRSGRLSVEVGAAQVRGLSFDGIEILRGLSAPVRDSNWGTFQLVIDHEIVDGSAYVCRFSEPSGLFSGQLMIVFEDELRCAADFTLHMKKDAQLNRAGFCLLHPIKGVAGSPMTVLHSNGTEEQIHFPEMVSPSQPAFDIIGLTYQVGPATVRIQMDGEVFEMEDQRNWSDASFKTYCRPLDRPYPFAVRAGEVIRQQVTLHIIPSSNEATDEAPPVEHTAVLPSPFLAYEAELSSLGGLIELASVPVLARIYPDTPPETLESLAKASEVALELVFDDLSDIPAIAERCRSAGLCPIRVVALPRTYLKSHQPQGPWPVGASPDEAVPVLRSAFPGMPVGTGSLTNFTEFNRYPPNVDVDFLTFGNTAIVHAADDLSVAQTLEALTDIFASAKALKPGKPLHLGLFSIGMRSNPYGTEVQPNPGGAPTPMAQWDRRQETEFAAAYAVGVLAQASLAGVRSVALAMPDGDLGAAGRPIVEVLRFAQRHADHDVRVRIDGYCYAISAGKEEIVGDLSRSLSGEVYGKLSINKIQSPQVLERSL